MGGPTTEVAWRVRTITARDALVVSVPEVGKLVLVLEDGAGLYRAISAGTGSAIWEAASATALGAPGLFELTHTYTFADAEFDVAAVSAAVDFGDALPDGAVVVAVYANTTVLWTDGAVGTFAMDVGISAGDDDHYTPTELNVDGATGVQAQSTFLPAGGVQLAVKVTGSVNLSTLTAGSTALRVLYCVPTSTAV